MITACTAGIPAASGQPDEAIGNFAAEEMALFKKTGMNSAVISGVWEGDFYA